MAADDFATTVEALYGGAPEQFIAARNAAAKRARAAGDRDLAERIKQLRRPTAAAALLNQHRRAGDADDLRALIELGEKLRAAQQKLDAPTMRSLSAERTPRIQAVVETIAAEAEEAGGEVSPAVREQLSETLTAAVADADATRAVLSGHLVSALSYSGFGEVDLSEAVAVPLAEKAEKPEKPARAKAGKTEEQQARNTAEQEQAAEKEQSEQARAAAEHRLKQALAILTKAQRAEESARQAADLAERALAAAERTAKNARERVDRATEERAAAEDAVAEARRRVSPS